MPSNAKKNKQRSRKPMTKKQQGKQKQAPSQPAVETVMKESGGEKAREMTLEDMQQIMSSPGWRQFDGMSHKETMEQLARESAAPPAYTTNYPIEVTGLDQYTHTQEEAAKTETEDRPVIEYSGCLGGVYAAKDLKKGMTIEMDRNEVFYLNFLTTSDLSSLDSPQNEKMMRMLNVELLVDMFNKSFSRLNWKMMRKALQLVDHLPEEKKKKALKAVDEAIKKEQANKKTLHVEDVPNVADVIKAMSSDEKDHAAKKKSLLDFDTAAVKVRGGTVVNLRKRRQAALKRVNDAEKECAEDLREAVRSLLAYNYDNMARRTPPGVTRDGLGCNNWKSPADHLVDEVKAQEKRTKKGRDADDEEQEVQSAGKFYTFIPCFDKETNQRIAKRFFDVIYEWQEKIAVGKKNAQLPPLNKVMKDFELPEPSMSRHEKLLYMILKDHVRPSHQRKIRETTNGILRGTLDVFFYLFGKKYVDHPEMLPYQHYYANRNSFGKALHGLREHELRAGFNNGTKPPQGLSRFSLNIETGLEHRLIDDTAQYKLLGLGSLFHAMFKGKIPLCVLHQAILINWDNARTSRTFALGMERYEHGIGLYPNCSRFNHCCHPNAVLKQNFGGAQVVTMREISKNEEIVLAYVDMPYAEINLASAPHRANDTSLLFFADGYQPLHPGEAHVKTRKLLPMFGKQIARPQGCMCIYCRDTLVKQGTLLKDGKKLPSKEEENPRYPLQKNKDGEEYVPVYAPPNNITFQEEEALYQILAKDATELREKWILDNIAKAKAMKKPKLLEAVKKNAERLRKQTPEVVHHIVQETRFKRAMLVQSTLSSPYVGYMDFLKPTATRQGYHYLMDLDNGPGIRKPKAAPPKDEQKENNENGSSTTPTAETQADNDEPEAFIVPEDRCAITRFFKNSPILRFVDELSLFVVAALQVPTRRAEEETSGVARFMHRLVNYVCEDNTAGEMLPDNIKVLCYVFKCYRQIYDTLRAWNAVHDTELSELPKRSPGTYKRIVKYVMAMHSKIITNTASGFFYHFDLAILIAIYVLGTTEYMSPREKQRAGVDRDSYNIVSPISGLVLRQMLEIQMQMMHRIYEERLMNMRAIAAAKLALEQNKFPSLFQADTLGQKSSQNDGTQTTKEAKPTPQKDTTPKTLPESLAKKLNLD